MPLLMTLSEVIGKILVRDNNLLRITTRPLRMHYPKNLRIDRYRMFSTQLASLEFPVVNIVDE